VVAKHERRLIGIALIALALTLIAILYPV